MSYGCGNFMCRGDPGFFGNLFHAVTGVIGGAVKGFISGGPVGGILGAAGGAVSATAHNIGSATLEAGGTQSAYTPQLRQAHAAALARGAKRGPGVGTQNGGGGMTGRRSRRMNWANGRALGRAERRIRSAVKHFSRYVRWVHPKREGHLAPKFGKKRRAA